MANRVIATGGAPPDINQQLLAQGAQGIGAGFGAGLAQRFALNRQARELNPIREAILMTQNQHLAPQDPAQAALLTALNDPKLFAQLSGGTPKGAVNAATLLGAPPQEARTVDRMIDGSSELGRTLGLQSGQQARVRFSYDARGNLIGEPSLAANPLSDEETGTGPFGASVRGRSLSFLADLAPGFAEGQLNPEQERLFLTSVNQLTQPEQFTDPDTGLVRTRVPELPRFARQALESRGYQLSQGQILPPVQQPPNPADVAALQTSQQNNTQLGAEPDAAIPPPPPRDESSVTLFEMAQRGDLNSPVPALQRFATRFGLQAQQEMNAVTAAVTVRERTVKALQQSPRYAEGEAQRIGQGFQFEPEVLATNSRYMQRVIAADETLKRIQDENLEVITGKRALVPGETRQHAMTVYNAVTNVREWLAPPRVNTDAEAAEFNRLNPPGTPVLYQDEDGAWQLGFTEGVQE